VGVWVEVNQLEERAVIRNKGFSVKDLTPRQVEVLIMIGKGMSYNAAAAKLRNKGADDGRRISWRTVETYAIQIRDLMDCPFSPTKALMIYYQTHREELENAA